MLCFYQNPAGERVRKHDKDENQIKENESQKKKRFVKFNTIL